MIPTAIKIYKEFNPKKAIKSPRTRILLPANRDNYGVRWFNKKRFKDILSLVVIDRQEQLARKMLPKTPSKMKYFKDVLTSGETHKENQFYVFALTDIYNEIIGWVQFMLDENVSRLRKIVYIERKALVFEVSYAKLFSQKLKGVAVNGLKNTIDIIRKMDDNDSKDLYITAYTESNNIASEFVLKTNRFEKLNEQISYENELNNVWIRKIN